MHMDFQGLLGQCGHVVGLTPELFAEYFDPAVEQECPVPECRANFDLWSSVKSCFVGAGSTFSLLAPLGGRTTIASVEIIAGQTMTLDLGAFGITPNDIVRGVSLTGTDAGTDGLIVPALMFGNQPKLPSHLPHQLYFYGVPQGPMPPSKSYFSVHVQYLPAQEEPHLNLLSDGAFAHGDHDYRRGIIDAHTAADIALQLFISRSLNPLTPYDESRLGFLEKVAVLALTRAAAGLSAPPVLLLEAFRGLNRSRNRAVHPSKGTNTVDEEMGAECLTASVFLMRFIHSASP
ncbi:hypothetical protein [Arthrobacter sp. CG_A4]|uniref:hypothetical protein n=1 Tax=Arthrobacter sp. CG_A4 TaxID=3071706 RepID=UPI002DF9A273|nr:hypothetical protein [Arthrobacter sp. CG_A4]